MTTPTGILFNDPRAKPLSTAGQPQAGCYYCFFLTGATTPTNVYADGLLTTPLSQPTPGSVNPSAGTVADSAGRFVPVYLNPATIYRAQLYTAGGSLLEDTDPYVPVPSVVPTQAQIGGSLYPEIAAETAVGATIVNSWFPYFCVDRYGTNTTPGTTDMTNAWNYATAAAMQSGGEVTYGYSSEYLVTGPINCTNNTSANQPGITIRGLGVQTADNGYGVLAKHTGVAVFDCTGNDSIKLQDLAIRTDNSTFPQTGVLFARNSSKGSLLNRMWNVKIQGKFSVACYYNYGSEDEVIEGCYFANMNTAANTKAVVVTSNNFVAGSAPTGLTSPFATIATGPVSCTDHNWFGNQYYNAAGTSTSDAIYIEASDSGKIIGGWSHNAANATATSSSTASTSGVMTVGGTLTGAFAVGQQIYGTGVPSGCVITSLGTGSGGAGTYNVTNSATFSAAAIIAGNPGRALIAMDTTNGASNFWNIDGLTGEVAEPLTTYGIYVTNNAATPVGWKIRGSKLANGGFTIAAGGSGPTMFGWEIGKTPITGAAQAGGLSWPGTLELSTLDTGTPLTVGTSSNNLLVGDTSTWAITTRSHDNWAETGTTNTAFAPGIASGTSGWTAVGAITQSGSLCYNSRKADFAILIQGATSIAGASGATIALPFTVKSNTTATVIDTSSGTVLCTALINGSTLTLLGGFTTNTHLVCIQGFGFVS